jgi:hypothetical protein
MKDQTMKWGAGASVAGAAVLALSALTLSPATGQGQGNVGTVKIDDVDLNSVPNNEPHVDDCVFEVEFFGYPANQEVTATITHVEPTGSGQAKSETITLENDDESGGGSAEGFDGAVTFDANDLVAGTEPQEQQGWHLRLDVAATGLQGGDKTKVFWVTGCAPPVTTTTTTTSTTTTSTTAPTTTTTEGARGTTTTLPGAPAPQAAPPPPAGRAPAPQAPAAAPAPSGQLAFTGSSTSILAGVGAVLLLVGAGLTLVARRRFAT